MRKLALAAAGVVAALVAGGGGPAGALDSPVHAGPQGDGTSITPVGWRVTPVGRQTTLGSLPTASALSPDGRLLLVLDAGDHPYQALQVVDTATGTVRQTIPYLTPAAVYAGVAFGPDGRHAYASGGGSEIIHTYDVSGGRLSEGAPITLPTTNPAGEKVNLYPAGLAVTPDGRRLVVADQLADAASVVDLTTGQVTTVAVGHRPYGVAISPDGRTAYVSDQGADTVTELGIGSGAPVVAGSVTVGTHPNRMVVDPRTGTLYVANSESDSVSVVTAGAHRPVRTIDLAPYPGAPVGSNPDGVALAPDGRTLYVANSGDNDVAVVSLPAGRVTGAIPTGWYATSVAVAPDGRTLYATSGKGLGAGPNPNGPNPYTDALLNHTPGWWGQYVGMMITGTLSTVAVPDRATLARYTARVRDNDGFGAGDTVRGAWSGRHNPVPVRVGEPSPITHVIYVVRENRTFDQEFGSLGKGNGDPSLNLFGEESAPNSRALERRFVTLDNFYANAEVSAQGWNWSVGANSNPYVEQTWPGNYSGRNHPYDYEGGNVATAMNTDPLDSYIWDRLADAGVSFRNYGFYETDNHLNTGVDPADPRLAAHTDPDYYGWDLRCPDSSGTFTPLTTCNTRYDEWAREFAGYQRRGDLPAVEFVRFGNDHTAGTTPGYPTPRAYVADNDYALGRLVDTVSHSRYWSSTAIFVVEDDAQAGPDHVDAHRTTAMVISPYTQTARVDSTFYSTVSMLRTMELLAGIAPMTQFDAAATPMFNSFTAHPDFATYDVTTPPRAVLTEVNTATAPLAAASASQSFREEDQADMQLLNAAIWASVKGAGSVMPAPRHSVIGPTAGTGTVAGTGER